MTLKSAKKRFEKHQRQCQRQRQRHCHRHRHRHQHQHLFPEMMTAICEIIASAQEVNIPQHILLNFPS